MTAQKKKAAAPFYDDEDKSRSQKKRESSALQKQGEELAALSPAVYGRLPLTPELKEALDVWRGLKSWEAKRRHMQYIGRLMREHDDIDSLLDALEDIRAESRKAARGFKHIEALRDALLQNGGSAREKALEDALTACPALDRARLAHLVGAALAEREKQRPPKHARELFRYLKATLGDSAP